MPEQPPNMYPIKLDSDGVELIKPREFPFCAHYARPFSKTAFLLLYTVTKKQRRVIRFREYLIVAFNVKTAENPFDYPPIRTHLSFVFTQSDLFNIRIGRCSKSLHIMITVPAEPGWMDHYHDAFYTLCEDIPKLAKLYRVRQLLIADDAYLVRVV